MNKILLFASAIFLISVCGLSQTKSVNIHNVRHNYAYRAFPGAPQSPLYFSYTVDVKTNGVSRNYLAAEDYQTKIVLEGQKRVKNADNADAKISASFGNIFIKSSEVKENKYETKDRDGQVTTTYTYFVIVTYYFDAEYSFVKNGKKLTSNILYDNARPLSFTSPEFDTRKAAMDYWNNNREVFIAQFYVDLANVTVKTISSDLTNKYGFASSISSSWWKTINEKKHNENEDFRDAAENVQNLFSQMTNNTPLDKEAVQPYIDYFKSVVKRYTDQKLKADVYLRYAAYFNLVKIYYFLDNPDEAIKYAEHIIENGYTPKDGEKLIKECEELKAAFAKSGIHTRHFDPAVYFDN